MAFDLFATEGQAPQPKPDVSQLRPSGATPGYDPNAVDDVEQQDYDRFVSTGVKVINGPAANQLIQAMNDKEQPVPTAAGKVLAQIVETVKNTFDNTEKPVSEDVIMHGSEELAEELINLGNAAGIWKIEDDQIEDVVARTMMEGAKVIGDEMIAKGNPLREDAKRFMTDQIENEMSSGEVPEQIKQNLLSQSVRSSFAGV